MIYLIISNFYGMHLDNNQPNYHSRVLQSLVQDGDMDRITRLLNEGMQYVSNPVPLAERHHPPAQIVMLMSGGIENDKFEETMKGIRDAIVGRLDPSRYNAQRQAFDRILGEWMDKNRTLALAMAKTSPSFQESLDGVVELLSSFDGIDFDSVKDGTETLKPLVDMVNAHNREFFNRKRQLSETFVAKAQLCLQGKPFELELIRFGSKSPTKVLNLAFCGTSGESPDRAELMPMIGRGR